MEYTALVRGNETTAGQQPMLVGSCMPQTLGLYTGETQSHLQGTICTCELQSFSLFTAGNSEAQGLLSSFSLLVIQNQKQIRTELHRLKFNQGIKNSKQIQKELLCRRKS